MPAAKKAAAGGAAKKASTPALHGSYKEMIRDAITALKDRNGSSRLTLKKYVQANNKGVEAGAKFDSQFNRAIKSGVEGGIFAQPKGPSGPIKLAKKDAAKAADKKPAAKKADGTKKATTKKPAAKKADAAKKPAAKKAATGTKKTTAAKPKSNTGAKRAKKTDGPAPAIVDEKKVLGKTSTGRVTKTKVPATASKKASTAKKAAKPKAAGAKKAAPKKEAAA